MMIYWRVYNAIKWAVQTVMYIILSFFSSKFLFPFPPPLFPSSSLYMPLTTVASKSMMIYRRVYLLHILLPQSLCRQLLSNHVLVTVPEGTACNIALPITRHAILMGTIIWFTLSGTTCSCVWLEANPTPTSTAPVTISNLLQLVLKFRVVMTITIQNLKENDS